MARARHVAKALAGVKPGTVLDHYTELYGIHKGSLRAGEFAQLVISRLEAGREESASEYGRRWGVNQRSAFLHREHAAEVFGPEWRSLVELLAAQVERSEGSELPSLATLVRSPV